MARILYFTADQQLTAVHHDGSIYTSAKHFTRLTTDGRRVVVERAIRRKSNPSNHKCDARCLNATGFRVRRVQLRWQAPRAGNFMCGAA